MKFVIITHAEHKMRGEYIFAYEPYVREMNLWIKYIDEVQVVAPISSKKITATDAEFDNSHKIKLIAVPEIALVSIKEAIKSIVVLPIIIFRITKAMRWASHIHLRCPGNIGLLGSIVQIAFPLKPKTIKYAGNWDPNSKQPWSYKLQKWILSNTFLTRNAKVLVYGEWPNQSTNIMHFFTASYSEKELLEEQIAESKISSNKETERHSAPDAESYNLKTNEQMLNQVQHDEKDCYSNSVEEIHSLPNGDSQNSLINFIFVGALTKGKQPLLSIKVIHQLQLKGYQVQLDIYGDGVEKNNIETYIKENQLQNTIHLHGNTSKEMVKEAYKKSHFLVFISKSEGWPKVVAEAMFWGCLPISSHVSCVPNMLDNGKRGALVKATTAAIVSAIESYLRNNEKYKIQIKKAMEWSRYYTLEKFEREIEKLL